MSHQDLAKKLTALKDSHYKTSSSKTLVLLVPGLKETKRTSVTISSSCFSKSSHALIMLDSKKSNSSWNGSIKSKVKEYKNSWKGVIIEHTIRNVDASCVIPGSITWSKWNSIASIVICWWTIPIHSASSTVCYSWRRWDISSKSSRRNKVN